MNCINDSNVADQFVTSTCWIQGVYIYKELKYRVDDVAYYGEYILGRNIGKLSTVFKLTHTFCFISNSIFELSLIYLSCLAMAAIWTSKLLIKSASPRPPLTLSNFLTTIPIIFPTFLTFIFDNFPKISANYISYWWIMLNYWTLGCNIYLANSV